MAIEDDIGYWQYFKSSPQMALYGPEVTSLGRWVGELGEVVQAGLLLETSGN